jgi:hypothetical protein
MARASERMIRLLVLRMTFFIPYLAVFASLNDI